jgi:hypothetical protein
MKEIIGDDYPTYEDSVNMTLAEQKNKSTTLSDILFEQEQHITKENMGDWHCKTSETEKIPSRNWMFIK